MRSLRPSQFSSCESHPRRGTFRLPWLRSALYRTVVMPGRLSANTENLATLTSSQQRAVIGVSSSFTPSHHPGSCTPRSCGLSTVAGLGSPPPRGLGPEPDCFMGYG